MSESINIVFEHNYTSNEILSLPIKLNDLKLNILYDPQNGLKNWNWTDSQFDLSKLENFWKFTIKDLMRYSYDKYPIIVNPFGFDLFFSTPRLITVSNGRSTADYFTFKEVRTDFYQNSKEIANCLSINDFIIMGGIGEGNWPVNVSSNFETLNELNDILTKYNLFFNRFTRFDKEDFRCIKENYPKWVEGYKDYKN